MRREKEKEIIGQGIGAPYRPCLGGRRAEGVGDARATTSISICNAKRATTEEVIR